MLGISSFLAVQLLLAQSAQALAPAEFYKGKAIELDISSSVGGGYDAYARVLARHIGRFIPGNPAVVPKKHGIQRLVEEVYETPATIAQRAAELLRQAARRPIYGVFRPRQAGTARPAQNSSRRPELRLSAQRSSSIAFSGEVDFRFAAENASNAIKLERFPISIDRNPL
jgi:hypothetical protein